MLASLGENSTSYSVSGILYLSLFKPDYEHAKTEKQNGSPELSSERRDMGTVIIFVAS